MIDVAGLQVAKLGDRDPRKARARAGPRAPADTSAAAALVARTVRGGISSGTASVPGRAPQADRGPHATTSSSGTREHPSDTADRNFDDVADGVGGSPATCTTRFPSRTAGRASRSSCAAERGRTAACRSTPTRSQYVILPRRFLRLRQFAVAVMHPAADERLEAAALVIGRGRYCREASTYETVEPGSSPGARYHDSRRTGSVCRRCSGCGCRQLRHRRTSRIVDSSARSNSGMSWDASASHSGAVLLTVSIGSSGTPPLIARPSFGNGSAGTGGSCRADGRTCGSQSAAGRTPEHRSAHRAPGTLSLPSGR